MNSSILSSETKKHLNKSVFVTAREDRIKITFTSGFLPFLIWLTKKAFAIKAVEILVKMPLKNNPKFI